MNQLMPVKWLWPWEYIAQQVIMLFAEIWACWMIWQSVKEDMAERAAAKKEKPGCNRAQD